MNIHFLLSKCRNIQALYLSIDDISLYLLPGTLDFFKETNSERYPLADLHISKNIINFFSYIFISWRLIALQYCSGFCHTLT